MEDESLLSGMGVRRMQPSDRCVMSITPFSYN